MTIRIGTLGQSTWKSLKLDFSTLIASIEKHSKKVDREAQVEHMIETSHLRNGTKPTLSLSPSSLGDQNRPRRIKRPIRSAEVSRFCNPRTRPRLMAFCSRGRVVLCTDYYEQ
jgi:hypothetical protein